MNSAIFYDNHVNRLDTYLNSMCMPNERVQDRITAQPKNMGINQGTTAEAAVGRCQLTFHVFLLLARHVGPTILIISTSLKYFASLLCPV